MRKLSDCKWNTVLLMATIDIYTTISRLSIVKTSKLFFSYIPIMCALIFRYQN